MIFRHIKSGVHVNDEEFDAIYTKDIKKAAEFHFTPVEVAKKGAKFLVSKPGTNVLDVGSGAGKFCMIGASCTNGVFIGVEQRLNLSLLANKLSKSYQLFNTKFIHSNILEIDFCSFDAIYFFNSFYENIFPNSPLDNVIKLDRDLYSIYSIYMKDQLSKMPIGTRLATYFSFIDEIPDSFKLISAGFDQKLKLWKKFK